jgi:hypothetical protein
MLPMNYNKLESSAKLQNKRNPVNPISEELNLIIKNNYFIFHKVLNFIQYNWNKEIKSHVAQFIYASQYYISSLFNDYLMFDDVSPLSYAVFSKLIKEQRDLGEKSIKNLVSFPPSTVSFTRYYEQYGRKNLVKLLKNPEKYRDFTPFDCRDII